MTRIENSLHRRESLESCTRPSSDAACKFGRYWAAAKNPRVGGYRGIGRCWKRNQGPGRTAGSTGERGDGAVSHTPAPGKGRAREKPEESFSASHPGVRFEHREDPGGAVSGILGLLGVSWRRRRSGSRVLEPSKPAHQQDNTSSPVHAILRRCGSVNRLGEYAAPIHEREEPPGVARSRHCHAQPCCRATRLLSIANRPPKSEICFLFTAVCVRVTLLGFGELGSCTAHCRVQLRRPIILYRFLAITCGRCPGPAPARSRWCQVT